MEILKKLHDFAIICAYILAVVGITGNLLHFGQPFFAVVGLIIDGLAFPYAKACFKDLLEA